MVRRPRVGRRSEAISSPDNGPILATAQALVEADGALKLEVSHVLDLRLRARGNADALALLDRALAILVQLERADAAAAIRLEGEISDLADVLALRFGAPRGRPLQ